LSLGYLTPREFELSQKQAARLSTKPATPQTNRELMKPTLTALAFLSLLGVAAAAEKPSGKPNIVLILADDLDYGDLGCYGSKRVKTPNIDRLAREGLRFTDFHSNGSTCSPTRAALMTGRYQQRSGIEEALSEKSPGLKADERTIAEYLKQAGYATAVIGRWHLGSKPDSAALPNRQGFDEFRGARHGGVDYVSHIDRYGRLDWWENEKPLREAEDLL
jgi:arylsulfatase A-like enzyme